MAWDGYNSENTHILATHEDNRGNMRMLLHYRGECKSEFVIGRSFEVGEERKRTVTEAFGGIATDRYRETYSWECGHYFQDFEDAADYWRREVLWREAEVFAISDEAGLNGCTLQVMYTNDGWSAHMYDKNGHTMTYDVSGFDSKEGLLEAFHRHRTTLTLESRGAVEQA